VKIKNVKFKSHTGIQSLRDGCWHTSVSCAQHVSNKWRYSVSSGLLNLAEDNGENEVFNTGRDFQHCVNNGHVVEPVDSAGKLF